MDLNTFQHQCLTTRTDTCENVDYPIHEIIEETSELYDKFFQSLPEDVRNADIQLRTIHNAIMHAGQLAKSRAKAVRKGEVTSVVSHTGTLPERREMALEAFDCLWGISALTDTMGFQLDDVASAGLQKLADRYRRNQIVGDGDHR